MNFKDIPQMTRSPNYRVNISWDYVENWITQQSRSSRCAVLDLDPDFQRNYVWNQYQKERYVEYILRGGQSGRDLYFNCAGWMADFRGPFVIVDGKQRLDAVRGFLRDEVLAFGLKYSEFEGHLGLGNGPGFVVNINDLRTRKEVLRWYIDLNTGGTVHTSEEIDKVFELINNEGK